MSYVIHIQKQDGSISESELTTAIELIPDLRVGSNGYSSKNPETGEVISISGGVVIEVAYKNSGLFGFGKKVNWENRIDFFNGRLSFKATSEIEDPKSPLRVSVAKLAKELSASVIGEEGEKYHW